jgi:hypothetical protein
MRQTGGTRIVNLLSNGTDPSTKGHTFEVAPLQLIQKTSTYITETQRTASSMSKRPDFRNMLEKWKHYLSWQNYQKS